MPLLGDPRPRAGFQIFLPAPRGFVVGVFDVTEMMNASLAVSRTRGSIYAIYEIWRGGNGPGSTGARGSPYLGEVVGPAAVSVAVR